MRQSVSHFRKIRQMKLLVIGLFFALVGCGNSPPQTTGTQSTIGSSNQLQPSKQDESDLTDEQKKANQVMRSANAAVASFHKGDYQNALKSIKQVCELEPGNLSYHHLRGDICFAAGDITQSIAAYDEVVRLDPSYEPRLWQRGLAYYYAEKFEEGVKQFETHQTVNSQDVENAVWHLLCAARISDVDQAREKLIPITGDERVPMSQIYEMFAGRISPEDVLRRAEKITVGVKQDSPQQKMQLYYAHLYTGLYHEMLKDAKSTISSLEAAEQVNPYGKANFMGQVARIHLMKRGVGNVELGK